MYNEPVITETENKEENINIKQIVFKYLSYWKWIIASLFVFLLLAFLYLKITSPVYDVQSSLLIKDSGSSDNDFITQLNLFSGSKKTDNEIEILNSYTLMERVVENLNLTARYYQRTGLRTEELYNKSPIRVEILSPDPDLFENSPFTVKLVDNTSFRINKKVYPFNTPINDFSGSFQVKLNDSIFAEWDTNQKIIVHLSPLQSATKIFQQGFDVNLPPKGKSTVLYLNQQVEVPQMGVDILNNLIKEYNLANVEDKNVVATTTLAFIDDRIALLAVELEGAEEVVERFKSANGITEISNEAFLFLQAVQQKDAELSRLNLQLSSLKSIEEYILKNSSDISSVPATLGLSDPTLLQLINQLTLLEGERTRSLQTVRSDNPIIIALDEQIQNIKKSIHTNVLTLKNALEISKKSLLAENARLENIIKDVPRKERQLLDITRQQNIKNELYIYLLSRREEIALSHAATVSDSRIIDRPIVSGPVKPVKRNIYLIFILLGLLFPVLAIYIKDLFRNKIESKNDITKSTDIPIIGEVSLVERKVSPLIINQKVRNKQAEQLRTLRTNLQFLAGTQEAIKTLLVTSNTSGEGKTFISLNLGASLALTKKKTVILGLDMRRPMLQNDLNLKNVSGLSLYLSGQETKLNNIIYPIPGFDNYDVIPAGPIPPNPIELIMGERMNILLQELEGIYDYIVIDSPPVGLVSDSLILAKYADVTLYIVRQNYTEKESIKNIDELYNKRRFKEIGIVINGMTDDTVYYGYKKSSSYYGDE